MREVGTCSSYNSHVSQGAEGGSNRGLTPVTPHNESSQPPSEEGTSPNLCEERAQNSLGCPVDGCPTTFTQERARKRHREQIHGDQSRLACQGSPDCRKKWIPSREHDYRQHLENVHKKTEIEIDEIIGRPAKRRPGRRKVKEYATFLDYFKSVSREDALPKENPNIHGECRLLPVDSQSGGSTTADIPPNLGMLYSPAFSSPVGGHRTSPASEDPVKQPILTLTDPYRAVDYVRSGQTPLPPWTEAAWTLPGASSWLG